MHALPLLNDSILEFFGDNPQVIIIGIVVIIGLIQGVGRTVKKMVNAGGGGSQPGGRRQVAPRSQGGSSVLEADPESILPGFLQTGIYDRAKREGVVREDDEDFDDVDDVDDVQEPVSKRVHHDPPAATPTVRVAQVEPKQTRRQREQARAALAPPREAHQARLANPVVSGQIGAPETTHDHDVAMARHLIHNRRPTRGQVRAAVLWAEILGPPRAVKPYASPARRGLRDAKSNPSAIAIMPLHDRPKR